MLSPARSKPFIHKLTNPEPSLPFLAFGPQEAILLCLCDLRATLVAESVKNPPAM